MNVQSIDYFINDLHGEFCGKPDHTEEKAYEEFFKLTCCFYKLLKTWTQHFKEVMNRYYILRGINDHNLKLILYRFHAWSRNSQTMELKGQTISQTTIGEIHNWVLKNE